jgi:hypothetical protein
MNSRRSFGHLVSRSTGYEIEACAVVASGASDRKDSTRRYGRRLLRCGISTRLMTAVGQGRPDSFASTLKVRRSAVGSGSGRHETARPMSQLGRFDPFTGLHSNGWYRRSAADGLRRCVWVKMPLSRPLSGLRGQFGSGHSCGKGATGSTSFSHLCRRKLPVRP